MGGLQQLSIHRVVKATKKLRHHQTMFSAIKNGLFDMDLYSYTPTLISAHFSTWVSLIATLCVSSLFAFCVGYTTYLWCVTDFSISQGEMAHDNSTYLIPPSSANHKALALPQAGVMLLLGNGTSPTDSSIVKFKWEQAVICHGDARSKQTDTLPAQLCVFSNPGEAAPRTNTTMCALWDAAATQLPLLNNTATNPCSSEGQAFAVPRVAGTFYDTEYSYVTATVSVNASLLSDSSFTAQLYKGSVQVYLQYPYTGVSSLTAGKWPDGQIVTWSKRVNLLAAITMKWEIGLRMRQVSAGSFFWDIPQLQSEALDYFVQFSDVSLASSSVGADGYLEIAKVFLKLDDRDMQVTMTPYANVFSLFSDWGGFLSILMALGIPAMMFNQTVFRNTVEHLMQRGDIAFDEDLRKKRSQAIATSFAAGVINKDLMSTSRRQSMLKPSSSKNGALAHLQDSRGCDSQDWMVPTSPQLPPASRNLASSSTLTRRVPTKVRVVDVHEQLPIPPAQSIHDVATTKSSDVWAPSSAVETRSEQVNMGRTSWKQNRVVPLPPLAMNTPSQRLVHGDVASDDMTCLATEVARTSGLAHDTKHGLNPNITLYPPIQPQAASLSHAQQADDNQDANTPAGGPYQGLGGTKNVTAVLYPSSPMHDPDAHHTQPVMSSPPQGVAEATEECNAVACREQSINVPPALRANSSTPGYGGNNANMLQLGSVDRELSQVSHYEAPQAAATASILVKYHQDIFEDSDEDENDFDDVVRHCTSECHALYHLRQVVKLVQSERSFLTCGTEKMNMVVEPVPAATSTPAERCMPVSNQGSKVTSMTAGDAA